MNNTDTATMQNIAAVYIESANAARNFQLFGDRDDLARHSDLFAIADRKFEALIAADGSFYNCELRDIRYAITQGNFADAKARYAELAK